MTTRALTGLRVCGWLAVSTAAVFLARAAVYSFAPTGTPLGTRLAAATRGPSLMLEIVACALAACASLAIVGTAVLAAAGHVLAWLRRAIARLVGGVEHALPEDRPRLAPVSNRLAAAREWASALGARAPSQHLLVPLAGEIPTNKEGGRMRVSRTRRAVLAVTALGVLVAANGAFAHAVLSPPVAKSKAGEVFTLAVPTEEENATTTTVELTPPAGFSIDSFAPTPGWKRDVQQTGEGEDSVIQKVTWSGGRVPTEEDAVFQFIASADSAKTYSFDVRQTYSNGKVVDWSGPESSDAPAPTVEAKSSISGGSAILPIIALVVGGLGVLLGLAALFAGRRTLA